MEQILASNGSKEEIASRVEALLAGSELSSSRGVNGGFDGSKSFLSFPCTGMFSCSMLYFSMCFKRNHVFEYDARQTKRNIFRSRDLAGRRTSCLTSLTRPRYLTIRLGLPHGGKGVGGRRRSNGGKTTILVWLSIWVAGASLGCLVGNGLMQLDTKLELLRARVETFRIKH